MKTKFALAERDPMIQVLEDHVSLEGIAYMKDILTSLSLIVFILNEKRQIVFANEYKLEQMGLDSSHIILGERPGELFSCVHADEEPGGCGTSSSCKYCGVVNTIIRSQKNNRREVAESAIIHHDGHFRRQIDLEVTATPFNHKDKQYTIVSFVDITETRRRQFMERIFYHDIINIAGSLNGMLEILNDPDLNISDRLLPLMQSLGTQIVDEIKAQRDMQTAEDGDLIVEKRNIFIDVFLEQLAAQMQFHRVATDKRIVVECTIGNLQVFTDPMLLTRVLINMLKNALEAVPNGSEVRLRGKIINGIVRFEVNNDGYMPVNVQMQVFQRSFSTKGAGRGLGTYSMKLIGERYIGGKVGFTSSKDNGTTFFIELPGKKKDF